jgi:hypothetical protein
VTDTFQWERCAADGSACTDIAGQTASTYLLTATDVGHTIRAAGARDGVPAATSQQTAIVAATPDNSSFLAATSWSTSRPAFTPTRTVNVTSAGQLLAAISDLRAGDLVTNTQPGGFSISGEVVIRDKLLSSVAVIDFKTGADAVRFTGFAGGGGSNSQLPALWLTNNRNLRLYGGDFTNPGGHSGWLCYGADHVLFWDSVIHGTGGDACSVIPAAGAVITDCDFYVKEASRWGQYAADDPHAEKGTGIHGCQFSDSSGQVVNTRFAIWGHDGPTGACLQYGSPSNATTGNTLYVKADRMTKASVSQRAGNGMNLWGGGPTSADVVYFEANDCQGYAVSVDTQLGSDFSTVVFDHARSTNTRQNPHWQSQPTFNPGPTYTDASGT